MKHYQLLLLLMLFGMILALQQLQQQITPYIKTQTTKQASGKIQLNYE